MRLRSAGAALTIIVGLLLSAACESPEEREADYVQNGKALFESHEYAKAAIEFRNALKINPTNPESKYLLGLVLERQGNLQAAFAAFQDVTFQSPTHREARIKLGQYALVNGDSANALLHADKAIELDPQRADGHVMRAAALLMQRKYVDVEEEIQTALSLEPNSEDALIVLASLHVAEKRPAEAEKVITDGLAANPSSVQLLGFRVKQLRDQGRREEVEDILRQLIAIEPGNPEHVIALAKDLIAEKRPDAAMELFRQSIAKSADKERLLGAYGEFLKVNSGAATAISEISALADDFAGNAKYQFLLARLHVEARQFAEASRILNGLLDSLQRQNEKLDVRAELARIELLNGSRDNAASQLDAIIQEDKGQHNALVLRANMAFEDRRFDSAIADARSALNEDPRSAGALAILAQSYLQTGEQDLAIDVLRDLTNAAPSNLDAHLQLAGLLLQQTPDEALEHIDAAIDLAPENHALRLRKAQALIYTKRGSQAEVIGHALLQSDATAGIGHQILGEAAFVRKDFATAIAELKAAMEAGRSFNEIGPKLTQAMEFAKSDATNSSSGETAESLLRQRIARDPRDALSLILLADLRLAAGDTMSAEQALGRAIEVDPTNSVPYLKLSQVLRQNGKIEEMTSVLSKAEKQFPEDRLMQESAAIGREISKNYEGARAAYQQVLQKWPNSMVAANNLAQLVADIWPEDRDQLSAARQVLEKYRSQDNPAILDTLGWVQTRLGNTEDAVILLERATTLAPDSREAQYHYAVALAQKGLKDKAKITLQKSLLGDASFRGVDDARLLLNDMR
jgi:tetratricopeptide (TPR) repeat protein